MLFRSSFQTHFSCNSNSCLLYYSLFSQVSQNMEHFYFRTWGGTTTSTPQKAPCLGPVHTAYGDLLCFLKTPRDLSISFVLALFQQICDHLVLLMIEQPCKAQVGSLTTYHNGNRDLILNSGINCISLPLSFSFHTQHTTKTR